MYNDNSSIVLSDTGTEIFLRKELKPLHGVTGRLFLEESKERIKNEEKRRVKESVKDKGRWLLGIQCVFSLNFYV